jgi:hypothetical protein
MGEMVESTEAAEGHKNCRARPGVANKDNSCARSFPRRTPGDAAMVTLEERTVMSSTIPIVSFVDRTSTRKRRTRFVFMRSVEIVIWNADQKSNGTFSNFLQRHSLHQSIYTANSGAVMDAAGLGGWLTDQEFGEIMRTFRQNCCLDVESRNKVRQCSLLPLAACITAIQAFGQSERTTAWLSAFNSLPRLWQMRLEDEEDASRGEVNLALQEDINEATEEAYDFTTELVMEFCGFECLPEDDAKMTQLPAAKINKQLASELKDLESFRTSMLQHDRYTSAVKAETFATEKASLLRFLNWYSGEYSVEYPTLDILRRADLGQRVQAYTMSLQGRELRWSSITNYLSGIIQCLVFAHSTLEQAPAHSYDSVCNLRRQSEKLAAADQLYKRKDANWIDWHPQEES